MYLTVPTSNIELPRLQNLMGEISSDINKNIINFMINLNKSVQVK